MIRIILLVCCFFYIKTTIGQSIYTVKEMDWLGTEEEITASSLQDGAKYYGIVPSRTYKIYEVYSSRADTGPVIDSMSAIKELLDCKGDTRICGVPVMLANPSYKGNKRYFSVQVQALYMIEQLLYPWDYDRHPHPVLCDGNTGKYMSMDEKGITRLFDAYIQWYEKVKTLSWTEAIRLADDPYKMANVYWDK